MFGAIALGTKLLSKTKIGSKVAGKLSQGVSNLFSGKIAKARKESKQKQAAVTTTTSQVMTSKSSGIEPKAEFDFAEFLKKFGLWIGLGLAFIIGLFFLLRKK